MNGSGSDLRVGVTFCDVLLVSNFSGVGLRKRTELSTAAGFKESLPHGMQKVD